MHESFDTHNVLQKAKEIIAPASTPIHCQNCGNVLQHFGDGWNFWFNGGIGVPGTPHLAAFSCESGEHWACSIECWEAVAHACVTQHLRATMEAAHKMLLDRKVQYEQAMKGNTDVSDSNEV